MTQIFLKVVVAMLIPGVALSANADPKLMNMMQRPLIIGASVSADHLTASPGKVLALRYTKKDQIKVHAGNGRLGREILNGLNEKDLHDRTVVIGFDLFFWDSFRDNPKISEEALANFLTLTKKLGTPVVLGEIPVFMPAMQPAAARLNKKIHEACREHSHCRLIPLNDLLLKTFTDGFIVQNGKKYSIPELLPDGLHIAAPASEFLADHIAGVLSR